MTCRIPPTQKTRELQTSESRRPYRAVIGQIKKHPKNAPAWRMETQLELMLVAWLFV
jgi:hypothetical protein